MYTIGSQATACQIVGEAWVQNEPVTLSGVILVTGGTGTLGTPTVQRLRDVGRDIRVLSRRAGPGRVVGDLATGDGIRDALAGVETVLHLATTGGPGDAAATRILLNAAAEARVSHLVYISIVGIDAIPLAYYRDKAECERMIVAAPVPHTILRATQFHNLVATIFAAQKYSPVLFAPSISVQPIEVAEVGARLVELVDGAPVGRVDDIGGPERLTGRELAAAWRVATGSRRAVWPLRLPGKTFQAIASGHNLVPGEPYGRATFAEFLAERFGGAGGTE
jgi:uncharacterized protein YbjT (DUF2867 family)